MVRTQLRVIYGDTDQMGVVYYANYLRYFEAGRNEFIRARGLRYRDFEARFGLVLPVAEAGVKYVAAARYDDLVSVETTLAELGRASARFTYRLLRDDALLATGFTLHACVEPGGRIRRLPAELVRCLRGEGAGQAQGSCWGMDRNLALEMVRVTEAAALASARLMGRGDPDAADRAAIEAMRRVLADVPMHGEIVMAEGEGEPPAFRLGERVGKRRDGDPELEIAVYALEGCDACATGGTNGISAIAMSDPGHLLRAPDLYMEKIAVGPSARGAVDLRRGATENLQRVAEAAGKYVEDLTVVILDRPRHAALIREVREAGARIKLIRDGDLAAAVSTCFPETGVDVLLGVGGAPEGVVAAAAIRCAGGELLGRFVCRADAEREELREHGIQDPDRVMTAEEMAGGTVMFAATGVTEGEFLKGVVFTGDGARTHSVVMRAKTATIRFIDTIHHFTRSPNYGW